MADKRHKGGYLVGALQENVMEGTVLEMTLKEKGGAKTEEGAFHVEGAAQAGEPWAGWSWLSLVRRR